LEQSRARRARASATRFGARRMPSSRRRPPRVRLAPGATAHGANHSPPDTRAKWWPRLEGDVAGHRQAGAADHDCEPPGSGMPALLAVAVDVLHTAAAQCRMGGMRADVLAPM